MSARTLRLFLLVSLSVLHPFEPKLAGATIFGVCYTRDNSGLPSARDVVSVYKKNGFGAIRIYEPDPDILQHLRGSGIHVIIGVKKNDLHQISSDLNSAHRWIHTHLTPYYPAVQFKYVAAGDEAIGGNNSYNTQFVLLAMENLHQALKAVGLEHEIKVSTAVSVASVLSSWNQPSKGDFSASLKPFMVTIARFLGDHDAPLLANVYPYFRYINNRVGIPLSSALLSTQKTVIHDGQLQYRSLFDAMVDALYAALEKVGAPDVRVVVAETGWPSAGRSSVATVGNAWRYVSKLRKHVSSGGGTPRRPGGEIETYVFAMFSDEHKYDGESFGLFYPNEKRDGYLVKLVSFPKTRQDIV